MQISQQLVQNFKKKLSGNQRLQIAYGNEKLNTMLSQLNVSQNLRQMIDNIYNDFQPFSCIMAERFDNTPKDQSNYYLRKESKKMSRRDCIN